MSERSSWLASGPVSWSLCEAPAERSEAMR
jgi:hypothetical protein